MDPMLVLRRYGGSKQVLLRDFDDLLRAIDLPETWWAATACPVAGMRCDPAVLERLDADADGIIHRDDLHRAVRWVGEHLAETAGCVEGSEVLALAALAPAADRLRQAAELVLGNLEAEARDQITLTQIRANDGILKRGARNGDGIVPPATFRDQDQRTLAETILSVIPGEVDRSGRPGLSVPMLERFAEARDQALGWYQQGDQLQAWDPAVVARAHGIISIDPALRAWFALSRLAGVDPQRAERIASPRSGDPDPRDPAAMAALLAELPVAAPSADGLLRWERLTPSPAGDHLAQLRESLPAHLSAADGITANDWAEVVAAAAAITAWDQARSSLPAARLEREQLLQLDASALAPLRELCSADAAYAGLIAAVDELETLVLYQRWLFRLANNFLNFSELHAFDRRALFEHGTLVIGGRELACAMLVSDRPTHQVVAQASGIRVLYVVVGTGAEQREYALPVTSGTGNDLIVGRRGVFRDLDGKLLPGRVVQVVENPVSLGEAVIQPFTRIGRFITDRLERWQQAKGKDLEASVMTAGKEHPATPPPPPPAPGAATNPLLGGSIAFAALGSSFAFVTSQLAQIQPLTILIAIALLIAVILIPTTLLAAIKLYRRNLAALLEANGWAINDRMRLTWAQGRLFTRRPPLPGGVRHETHNEMASILAAAEPDRRQRRRLAGASLGCSLLGLGAMLAAFLDLPPDLHRSIGAAILGAVLSLLALILANHQRQRHPALLAIVCILAILVVILGGSLAWRLAM